MAFVALVISMIALVISLRPRKAAKLPDENELIKNARAKPKVRDDDAAWRIEHGTVGES